MIEVRTFNSIDLGVSTKTPGIPIDGKGPITIQPTLVSMCGSATYTVEVSIDADSESGAFTPLSVFCSNLPITDSVQINYNPFPWKWVRISTTSREGDSGRAIFKMFLG